MRPVYALYTRSALATRCAFVVNWLASPKSWQKLGAQRRTDLNFHFLINFQCAGRPSRMCDWAISFTFAVQIRLSYTSLGNLWRLSPSLVVLLYPAPWRHSQKIRYLEQKRKTVDYNRVEEFNFTIVIGNVQVTYPSYYYKCQNQLKCWYTCQGISSALKSQTLSNLSTFTCM